MINFRKYLINEGRDAPLYHATSVNSIGEILKSNKLLPSLDYDVISLTRNFKFATEWKTKFHSTNVSFTLDQAKLTQKYKITPYDHFETEKAFPGKYKRRKGKYAEAEEIIRKDITPLSKYVTSLNVSAKLLDWVMDENAINGIMIPILASGMPINKNVPQKFSKQFPSDAKKIMVGIQNKLMKHKKK